MLSPGIYPSWGIRLIFRARFAHDGEHHGGDAAVVVAMSEVDE
jgi:hypothetical protein